MDAVGRDHVGEIQLAEQRHGIEVCDLVALQGVDEGHMVGLGFVDAAPGPCGQVLRIEIGLVGRENDKEGHALFAEQALHAGEADSEVVHLFRRNLGGAQGVDQQDVFEENGFAADDEGAFAHGGGFDMAEQGIADLAVEADEMAAEAEVVANPGIRLGGEFAAPPALERPVSGNPGCARGCR
jgi:hypothetical protein